MLVHVREVYCHVKTCSLKLDLQMITKIIHVLQEAAAENVTVLLLGNKSDHEQRQVKTQQGEILAKVSVWCIHSINSF